jgi:hypothetical protein
MSGAKSVMLSNVVLNACKEVLTIITLKNEGA